MATYNGTRGNDTYTGGSSNDLISGEFGRDTLSGGGGADTIYGEAAINPLTAKGTETGTAYTLNFKNNTTDTLYLYSVNVNGSVSRMLAIAPGETITQSVRLDAGRVIGNFDGTEFYTVAKAPGSTTTTNNTATLTLNSANDLIDGGAGNDRLFGQVGADTILGGDGADYIEGGTGNDSIDGGTGNDSIIGGDGADIIIGGIGDDTIAGGNDNDSIRGDAGADVIQGGSGNDTISGGDDNDWISGDGGDDSLMGDAGADTIDGSLGNDYISGGTENDLISGGADNDTLLGDAGDDTVHGGGNDDSILGGAGYDQLYGDSGNDFIDGGTENDLIEGGIGDDTLLGGYGDDTIYGDSEDNSGSGADIAIAAGTVTSNNINFTNVDTGSPVAPLNWQSVVVDGKPYLVTTAQAYDGYLGVYRLNDDGTLTKTDWMTYQDGGNTTDPLSIKTGSDGNITNSIPTANRPVFGNALTGAQFVDINGVMTMFVTSRNASGVSAWTLDSNGTIDLKGSIHYGGSQTYQDGGNTVDHTVYVSDSGTVFLYASRGQNDYISRLVYNPNTGSFTESTGFNVPTGDNTSGMMTLTVGGNDFLAVSNATGLQLFKIDSTTGNLTETASATATTQAAALAEADVYVKPDGTTYVAYSNPSAEEVLLYRVGADGSLTATGALAGQGDFSKTHSVSYVNGEPVIVVTDPTSGLTRLYTISDDGTFVLEAEIPGLSATGTPPIIMKATDGTYYLVDARSGQTVKLNFLTQDSADKDYIDGGLGNDLIDGGVDNDTILGNVGQDTISGGAGDDSIDGGADNDSLSGGLGKDTIFGGTGADSIDGGVGDDSLSGGDGNDTILGGIGNDTVLGGIGDDSIDGGADNDSLSGGDGNDTILGGAGADSIDGGADNDSLSGGDGNDTILGGTGNDTVLGGIGDDSIDGGANDDSLSGEAGNDTILGGAGADFIDGGADNDKLLGGDGDDTILGGIGADSIDGGADNDSLSGGDGNDTIVGGAGADQISGGIGDDSINGGDGNDVINGDAGNDTIIAGVGDSATGGADRDNFVLDASQLGTGSTFTVDGSFTGNDYDTVDLNGLTIVSGSYRASRDTDGNSNSGTVRLTDGANFYTLNFTEIEAPICFCRGTLIETINGAVAVEKLRVGDLILTKDNGYQPIRWLRGRIVAGDTVKAAPERFSPIRISAGALGENYPEQDLYVSPQHRLLIQSAVVRRMCGEDEVLVPAKRLLELDGIEQVSDFDEVEYFHFLFDDHEIVFANGTEAESLYLGQESLKSIPQEARDEIFALFPDLLEADFTAPQARIFASGKQSRQLVRRYQKRVRALFRAA